MSTLHRRFLLLVLSVCLVVVGRAQVSITLLHVNDTHSHLDAVGPKNADLSGTLGGIARAASVIGETRATDPHVVLLHAGDAFQGDLFFNNYLAVPELQLMLKLGFDAMAVGNHEFDLGPEVLNEVLSIAFADESMPLLSANLDLSAVSSLNNWIRPSMIKTVGGVKLGIFGLTVPGNPTTNSGPVIISDDIGSIAYQQVTALRAEGAEVVICLSHLGVYLDKIIASNVPGIDFIIGGHDHYAFAQPIAVPNPSGVQTLIFQAGEHYKHMGRLRFTVSEGIVSVQDYALIDLDAHVPVESSVQETVEFLKQGIVERYGDLYGSVIGNATQDLEKLTDQQSAWKDSPMGNLVTDAFRQRTGTEIAITPTGLISEKIYAGPIVGADVFRSMSYGFDPASGLGFKLVTGVMTGADLLKGLEIGLSQLEITEDFFLQVSGIEFTYHSNRPVGHRVTVGSIRIGGRAFVPTKTYSITINEGVSYLLEMFGITLHHATVLDEFEYTAVRDYMAGLGTVEYASEGRIRDINAAHPPLARSIDGGANIDDGAKAHLAGNYPNPFNPTTTIRFHLSQPQHVSLKVYNVVGQEVATLVNADMGSGVHSATFDASHLPSGIYFSRFVVGSTVETKQMILMK